MNKVGTFIWDDECKFEVKKLIDLSSIISYGPCSEALVEVIQALPKEVLLLEIDPNDYEHTFKSNLDKFIKALRKLNWNLSWDILNFLEGNNFLKWHEPTKEETNRYWKNEKRRLQRAAVKKNNRKK